MQQPRTEEQKLMQTPAIVKLGGKDYEIKPLPIILASPWRKKFVGLLMEGDDLSLVTSDNPKKFQEALADTLLKKPDELMDLFFEYAKDLDKNEIENIASSIEILTALEEVIAFESPFLGMAARVIQMLKKNLVQ